MTLCLSRQFRRAPTIGASGAIAAGGKVGRVGGLTQKALGLRQGANLFLLPQEQVDASEAPAAMQLNLWVCISCNEVSARSRGTKVGTLQRDAHWVAENLVQGAPVAVGQPDITELVRNLRSVSLAAGETLYAAGESVPGTWIVRSGSIAISQGTGTNRCVVSLLHAGDVVGDTHLLLNMASPFTARSITPTTCWFLDGTDFRRLIAHYPSIGIGWLCNLASRLCRSRERTAVVVNGSLPQRVARTLLLEAGNGEIRLPQRTIAQMLGVQRTSVNKILKELERQGILLVGYGKIDLLKAEALESLAQG